MSDLTAGQTNRLLLVVFHKAAHFLYLFSSPEVDTGNGQLKACSLGRM